MKLLDTTVRDGSYAVDFKFTCEDVKKIVKNADQLGFEYIEIGHGQGLNASSAEHGISLHTDEEYMRAALEVTNGSKLGFFAIPGIARMEDIALAKKYGISFLRIGINAGQTQHARCYIEEGKRLGFTVMANFMKTYTLPPEIFAENCLEVQMMGADSAYIVDSAGCMLPNGIEKYYDAARKVTSIQLGFHGHDNLGMAIANSLFCVEKGFDLIDCSFQGLGRSCGNASSEKLIMALKKMGYPIDIDIPRLLEYGYAILKDITDRKLQQPLDLMCGYAGFHSGYLKYIYRCCMEKKVDPLRLIQAYSEIDQVNLNYNVLCQVAEQLPKDNMENPYNFREFFATGYND